MQVGDHGSTVFGAESVDANPVGVERPFDANLVLEDTGMAANVVERNARFADFTSARRQLPFAVHATSMVEIGHIATEARQEHGRTRQLLGMTDVARELGIARSTAYLWAHAGRLPVVHRGDRMFVPRAALAAFLAAEAEAALHNLTNGGRVADDDPE